MSNIIVEPRGLGRPLNVIGDAITPLITDADGVGFELFDLEGPAGSGPPPHSHPWIEMYYVLDGQVAVTIENAEHLVERGHVVNVPAGVLHAYRITSDTARFLVVTSPEGAGAFFSDVDANVSAMPESAPTLIEVAKRNRLSSPIFG